MSSKQAKGGNCDCSCPPLMGFFQWEREGCVGLGHSGMTPLGCWHTPQTGEEEERRLFLEWPLPVSAAPQPVCHLADFMYQNETLLKFHCLCVCMCACVLFFPEYIFKNCSFGVWNGTEQCVGENKPAFVFCDAMSDAFCNSLHCFQNELYFLTVHHVKCLYFTKILWIHFIKLTTLNQVSYYNGFPVWRWTQCDLFCWTHIQS